jgi:hypothetical protein
LRIGNPFIAQSGIGSLAERCTPLALAIPQKKPVPSTVFVKHELITPKNVGFIYPVQTE